LSSTLVSRLDASIDKAAGALTRAAVEKSELEQRIVRLQQVVKSGQGVAISATSAFETLHLLKNGRFEQTQCPICLWPLGDEEGSQGLVLVTSCGHLFCRGCLENYFAQRGESIAQPCVACRKPLKKSEVKLLDPRSTSDVDTMEARMKSAAAQIQQAAAMLEQSNGQLPSDIWEALYLAMEPPLDAHCSGHPIYTAIPSLFLAHLNRATTMRRDSGGHLTDTTLLTSKIRALLADIPEDERSVVFTSSKQGVKLLANVLKSFGVGCRSLFNGQDELTAERAVEEWKLSDEFLVLIVQSGAAACGLYVIQV
jgi:hypothetical protein